MSAIVLNAEVKDSVGKGVSRELRRNKMVPCVVYGDDKEPTMLAISYKDAMSISMRGDFYTKVIELSVGDKKAKISALPKAVQFHPVSGDPLHLDFQRLSHTSKVKLRVPVEFINSDKSPAIKLGGLLNIVSPSVELLCSPSSIPDKFEIDLANTNFGWSLLVRDLNIPEGCSLSHSVHTDAVLANIVQPQKGVAETAAGNEE